MSRCGSGTLERCWLTALRLSWRYRMDPDTGSARMVRLLVPMGLVDSVDGFIALATGLNADGVRCLDIRAPDCPHISHDETALLEALAALCLDDPLEAEHALAGLFPPGRGQTSLRLLDEIAGESRRIRPATRRRWWPEDMRLH